MRTPAVPHLAVDGRVLDDRYHGIGRSTAALLDAWAGRDDVRVTVFVTPQQRSERLPLDAVVEGNGHARATFAPSLTSPTQWLRWSAALRRVQADVALFPYHLGAAWTGRARRCTIVHDCILEADPSFAPSGRATRLYPWLTRIALRRSEVLTPSQASADEIRRHYGVTVPPSHVVPWGVDTSFAAGTGAVGRAIGTDGLGATAVGAVPVVRGTVLPSRYLLHVGARRPHKNVAVLVKALALLPADVHLVLVGDVDRRMADPVPDAVRACSVADRVHHFASVDEAELRLLYARAAAFVYPSLVEGFGLPLLEAMAAGLPVVASDVPVFREIAGPDAAVLVPPRDPAAWAHAVADVLDGTRREALVAAGRAVAAAATWQRAADRLLAVLLDGMPQPSLPGARQ